MVNSKTINTTQRLRIKDIARLAGVSEGTVDRVIHDRGHVSGEKLQKIEAIIGKHNYRPNMFARSLAAAKEMCFMSLIPKFESGSYWSYIKQGLERAKKDISDYRIQLEHLSFDQYDRDSFIAKTEKILAATPDAVIFSPVFIEESLDFANKLAHKNIPCVLVDSNVEAMQCLAYYGQHSLKSGYTAARLLFAGLPENSTVVLARSLRLYNIGSNQAGLREKGFMQYIEEHNLREKYNIVRVDLHADNAPQNLVKLRTVAAQHSPISGAVIFSSKVHRLVYYFSELRLTDVKIIGYDELSQNVAALKSGKVSYLIAQRPEMQGYLGVQDLCKHLLLKQPTHRTNYMPVDILTKDIVDEYMQFNGNIV